MRRAPRQSRTGGSRRRPARPGSAPGERCGDHRGARPRLHHRRCVQRPRPGVLVGGLQRSRDQGQQHGLRPLPAGRIAGKPRDRVRLTRTPAARPVCWRTSTTQPPSRKRPPERPHRRGRDRTRPRLPAAFRRVVCREAQRQVRPLPVGQLADARSLRPPVRMEVPEQRRLLGRLQQHGHDRRVGQRRRGRQLRASRGAARVRRQRLLHRQPPGEHRHERGQLRLRGPRRVGQPSLRLAPRRKRVLRDARSWRIEYGGAAWLGGDATLRRNGQYFWDTGVLYQKRYGTHRCLLVRPKHRAFSDHRLRLVEDAPATTHGLRVPQRRQRLRAQHVPRARGQRPGTDPGEDRGQEGPLRRTDTDHRRVPPAHSRSTGQPATEGQRSVARHRHDAHARRRELRPAATRRGRRDLDAAGRQHVGQRQHRQPHRLDRRERCCRRPKPKPPSGCQSDCGTTTPAPAPRPGRPIPPRRRTTACCQAPGALLSGSRPRTRSSAPSPPVPSPRTTTAVASPL